MYGYYGTEKLAWYVKTIRSSVKGCMPLFAVVTIVNILMTLWSNQLFVECARGHSTLFESFMRVMLGNPGQEAKL